MYRVIKETKGDKVSYKLQNSLLGLIWEDFPFLFECKKDICPKLPRCSTHFYMSDDYFPNFLKFVKEYFKHNKKRIKFKHWYIYPKFVDIESDKPKVKFVYGRKWVTPKDTLYFCGDFDTLEECKAYLKEYYESNLESVETIG